MSNYIAVSAILFWDSPTSGIVQIVNNLNLSRQKLADIERATKSVSLMQNFTYITLRSCIIDSLTSSKWTKKLRRKKDFTCILPLHLQKRLNVKKTVLDNCANNDRQEGCKSNKAIFPEFFWD